MKAFGRLHPFAGFHLEGMGTALKQGASLETPMTGHRFEVIVSGGYRERPFQCGDAQEIK